MKLCSRCEKNVPRTNRSKYCVDCKLIIRRKNTVKGVSIRRKKMRLLAISYGGGRCKICGYSKCIAALEYHHLDPAKKDFTLSARGITRSWEKTKNELDKCILLCSNCHRETHAAQATITATNKLL